MQEQNYRKARKDAGIRLEQAASTFGVSVTTLLNWENGKTSPNAQNIKDMAELYRVSADYLISME